MITTVQGIAAGLLLGLVVGSGGAWYVQGLRSETALAAQAKGFDDTKDAAIAAGITEQQRQLTVVANVAEEGRKEDVTINAHADTNAASTVGLQHAATVYASTASCDAGSARRGASATRAAMVLSDMLGKSNERASQLAKTADDARARGLRCERAWDQLKARDKSG